MLDKEIQKVYNEIEKLDTYFKDSKVYGHFTFEFNYIDGNLAVINKEIKDVVFKLKK